MTEERRDDMLHPPTPGQEPTARQRIDLILHTVEEVQEKFQTFSTKVIALVAIMFVLTGASIAGFAYVLSQVHSSRVEATERSCVLRNKQNIGILAVFTKFKITDPSLIDLFPIEPDCEQYAKDSV